jgi:hypothetical protein
MRTEFPGSHRVPTSHSQLQQGHGASQRDLSFSFLENIAAIDHQDGSIHVACAV